MSAANEQHENKASFYHLDLCCRYVGEKYGRPEIANWTNSDYIKLSSILSRHTDVQISPSTLKRIFGKLKTSDRYYPQKATRDALAQYAGFTDWADFIQKNQRPLKSEEKAREQDVKKNIESPVLPAIHIPIQKSNQQKRLWPLTVLSVTIVVVAIWLFQKKEKPVSLPPVKAALICNNPEGENPHSAVFKIELPENFSGDPSKFTMDFGDGRSEKSIKPDPLVTHYYEVPGRYYAVLKHNGLALDTVAIYLKTNGWTATADMEHDTVRVYPVNNALFKNGKLRVNGNELFHAGVDTNRTFFVDFVHTNPLSISGDNFELSANVTTSLPRPGIRCSQVNITVYGETSQHSVMFIKAGCVSWAYLRFSEILKDGERDDLSSIGADLTAGGIITLQVINKKVNLMVNGKMVYETSYSFPLQKIYGLKISFAGIGTINDLSLKDLATAAIFNGNFKKR